jgi:hypothetical protein
LTGEFVLDQFLHPGEFKAGEFIFSLSTGYCGFGATNDALVVPIIKAQQHIFFSEQAARHETR